MEAVLVGDIEVGLRMVAADYTAVAMGRETGLAGHMAVVDEEEVHMVLVVDMERASVRGYSWAEEGIEVAVSSPAGAEAHSLVDLDIALVDCSLAGRGHRRNNRCSTCCLL